MNLFKHKLIIFILFSAFICRLIGIDRGVWNDELITINTLKNNIFINPFYYGYTTNLPLYFYVFKIWTINGLFLNITYLRLLGVIINLLNIYILYKFISDKNKLFAVLTAILIAISPLQIHYSQELRPYILTQLLITIHFLLTIRNMQKNIFIYDKKLTIITILLLLTHYAAYLYLAAAFLIILIIKKQKIFNVSSIVNFITIGISKLIIIFAMVSNPKFFDSLNNTGINNTDITIKTFFEMFIRIKEVITFYYFFGFWYYIASSSVQNIFKKIFILLTLLSVAIIFYEYIKNKKINLIPFTSLTLLIIVMPLGFYLEKFGLYPFGGRHIMPFSIFLYIIIAYLFNWIWNQNKLFGKITVIILYIFTIVTLIFHQKCSITIINTKGIEQKDSYSYCIKSYINITQVPIQP